MSIVLNGERLWDKALHDAAVAVMTYVSDHSQGCDPEGDAECVADYIAGYDDVSKADAHQAAERLYQYQNAVTDALSDLLHSNDDKYQEQELIVDFNP